MKVNISHLAKLANLKIPEDKVNSLQKQLMETLDYINQLSEIDTKSTIETSQVTGLENVDRNDSVKISFTQEQALSNSKNTYNGYFKVSAILDKNE